MRVVYRESTHCWKLWLNMIKRGHDHFMPGFACLLWAVSSILKLFRLCTPQEFFWWDYKPGSHVYMFCRKITCAHWRSCTLCQSLVDCGNANIPSMHHSNKIINLMIVVSLEQKKKKACVNSTWRTSVDKGEHWCFRDILCSFLLYGC